MLINCFFFTCQRRHFAKEASSLPPWFLHTLSRRFLASSVVKTIMCNSSALLSKEVKHITPLFWLIMPFPCPQSKIKYKRERGSELHSNLPTETRHLSPVTAFKEAANPRFTCLSSSRSGVKNQLSWCYQIIKWKVLEIASYLWKEPEDTQKWKRALESSSPRHSACNECEHILKGFARLWIQGTSFLMGRI